MGLSLQFKGFNYTASYNGDYEFGDTYAKLLATGTNAVALTYHNGINVATSTIFQNYDALPGTDVGTDRGYTETGKGVADQVRRSRVAGQSVLVRPFAGFLPESVTGVSLGRYAGYDWQQFYHPTSLATFFSTSNPNSYTSFIVNQAKAAQAAGAQVFDIGTELDQLITTRTLGYWSSLVQSVRAVFTGQLTYSASLSSGGSGASAATIPTAFWKQLDYVGVDAYVAASDPNDLVGAWTKPPTDPDSLVDQGGKSAIDFLDGLATAAGKPLLLTEVGWTDSVNAASNPLDQSGQRDPSLQAALYRSFFDAWGQAGVTSLVGSYFFNWNPASFDGGQTPSDFTPQNNQGTLDTVVAGFSAPAPYVVTLTAGPRTLPGLIADTSGPREVIVTPFSRSGSSGAAVAGGQVLFTGANTYSGGTLIQAGIVGLGNAKALGTGGLAILAGELDLNGFGLSLPTLRGGGTILLTPGKSPTVGPTLLTVASGTFAGALRDTPGQTALELVKVGDGTLTLSGQSAYTTTLLEGGTLKIAGATAAGGSAIAFGAGPATLEVGNAALATTRAMAGLGYVFGSVITGVRVGDQIILDGVSGTPTLSFSQSRAVYNLTLSGLAGIAGGKVTLQFGVTSTYAAGLDAVSVVSSNGNLVISVDDDPVPTGVTATLVMSDAKTLNKIAGGYAVSDKAASIVARLATLASNADHITSIETTDKLVTITTASLSYRAALDKLVDGYAISDQATAIQSNLDGISSGIAHVTAITQKGGQVTVSVAAFLKNRAALDKITGGFAISDTAARVTAALASITADAPRIASITATDKAVSVGVGTFLANKAALDKVVGGVAIIDQPASFSANVDALAGDQSHIRSVSFGSAPSPVVSLTSQQASANAALLAKITSSYVLGTSDGTSLTTIGHGNRLTIHADFAAGPNTITGGGSSETFVFDQSVYQSSITDFYLHDTGVNHDTIYLPKGEFADFAAVLHDAVSTSAGTTLTSHVTRAQLSLPRVTATDLQAGSANFKFI